MTKIIELRPDKTLINKQFEKYQFSADAISIVFEKDLQKEVLRIEPNSSQDSWLETRLFAFHNHLFKNPFDATCWFVDENRGVWRLEKNGILELIHILGTPDDKVDFTYNPSIGFASEKTVAISNGHKNLEILIEDASEQLKSFIFDVDPGIILDVQFVKEKSTITIAMCSIAEVDGKKYSRVVLLSYLRKKKEDSLETLEFTCKQVLCVRGVVEYVCIEENGNYLHTASQDSVTFEYDSSNPVRQEQAGSKDDLKIKIPKYCWSQDEDTLTVWVKIPENVDKNQIKVNVSPTTISIMFNDTVLIQGNSEYRLDADSTSWMLERNSIKVDLAKHESRIMWNELIKGDTGGECLPKETLAAEIHSRLAYFSTEQSERGAEGDQPVLGFNADQLEECDVQGRENLLQRIDLTNHKITHLAMLGTSNRVLFTYKLKSGQALCLRHDHDGCLWIPGEADDSQWELKHICTFPGFGYVEASKTNKKFCVSPPDGSYVAIVEHTRHAFLYEKPEGNTKVGKQQIIDLGCDTSPIMGATASNEYLTLLTKNKLYQLQILP